MSARKYSSNPTERFMEVLNNIHLPPALKAKTLTAIAYSMNLKEIIAAKEAVAMKYGSRLKHLRDLGAPQVIIDNEERLLHEKNAYLERAERRQGIFLPT